MRIDTNTRVGERPSYAVDMFQPLLKHHQRQHSDQKELFNPNSECRVDGGSSIASTNSPNSVSCTSLQSHFSTSPPVVLIDNTTLVYIPIRLASGNQVYCAPDVLSNCPMILRSVQADLLHILRILPWSVHALVKRTNIWINASYSYGSRDDPKVLRHSAAHHQSGWLVECARDRPEKAQGIEIYSCFDFERMRLHWNGCGLLLHEMCHLIHQNCLGLDCPKVQELYTKATLSGKYERVLRRDWAGKPKDYDMAYAMIDLKEFFAEMSVTYLSNGYHELDHADKTILEESCPPLLEPTALTRVLQQYGIEKDPYQGDMQDECSLLASLLAKHRSMLVGARPKIRMANPIWQEAAVGRGCRDVVHCNKFYPFTRGQLRHHDPELLQAMHELWNEIAMFDDPLQDQRSCCFTVLKQLSSFRV